VADSTDNIVNPSLSYDSGVLTFRFQRARNTGDTQDWSFASDTDCYYFVFPIGGGPHSNTDFRQHSRRPIFSEGKLCIGT